jgi:hypothetical protein
MWSQRLLPHIRILSSKFTFYGEAHFAAVPGRPCCSYVFFNNFLCNHDSSSSYSFYIAHSSQSILRKRREHPDWTCVRTSRLKSYIEMVMPANLSSFWCALQEICQRDALNSPKLSSAIVGRGLLCGFSPLWFLWIFRAHYRLAPFRC